MNIGAWEHLGRVITEDHNTTADITVAYWSGDDVTPDPYVELTIEGVADNQATVRLVTYDEVHRLKNMLANAERRLRR